MNVGYTYRAGCKADDQVCPICGGDIYISKYGHDFSCINVDCPLKYNASLILDNVEGIEKIMNMIANKE